MEVQLVHFCFKLPTQIIFRPGALEEAAQVVHEIGHRALLVVGSKSMRVSSTLDQCRSSLVAMGIVVDVYDGVASNPTYAEISRGIELTRQTQYDVIVALGGGSAMDAARILSLAATHEGDFWDYRVTGSKSVSGIHDGVIPVVTIPSIAGTGAEISPAALVTRNKCKEVFFSPYLYPRAAIVDPSLALTAPPTVTAQVGVDAFVQGLEAYVSSNAQAFSDVFALEAMRVSYQWLTIARNDVSDLDARSMMAFASLLSMFAVTQAGVGAVHALSDPLSGRLDLHHGVALATVLTAVMKANWPSNPKKFEDVARLIGVEHSGDDLISRTTSAIEAWLQDLGLCHKLCDLGVCASDLSMFAREAINPGMQTNPRQLNEGEIVAIYRDAL